MKEREAAFEFLRELRRAAVEDDDGWPVNSHDAYVRLGARFEEILPRLIDVAEEADKFGDLDPGLHNAIDDLRDAIEKAQRSQK